MTHHVRVLDPDELRAAHTLFAAALHLDPLDDESWERRRHSYLPGRTLGVSDSSGLIGTTMSFPARTAVPGAALPTAAVSRVGVRADRTRRGVLSELMRAQFDDAAVRGEVIATLRASEARIYGRFGYGVATRAREVTVGTRGGLRDGAPPGGTVRMLPAGDIVAATAAVHARIALDRVGGMTRHEQLWDQGIGNRVRRHEHVVAAVHTGPGGDDGYAVAVPGGSDGGFADRALRVTDLHAAGVDATAGLWRFLLGLDLIGRVEGWMRPVDEPLELLLADPRDCRVTGETDETWLRILDVPAALAARSWGPGRPVRIAVRDPLRPRNEGVYRIGEGRAEPVDAAPELQCDVAALAMAYLGDRAPSQLAATGWWHVHDPAAVARADAVFATATRPWCGTFF
ncbi:GNAT family N-acetyltransferase [Pseudonocardia sp.]|uniref:GNAT family N-acetyltransferase n=1 Tax=Pseudonocardia sp. TaxID=60912 RepID=UPI00261AB023|nr:GNAT family N-acetyltransferase [Pseudonocardia sp.]